MKGRRSWRYGDALQVRQVQGDDLDVRDAFGATRESAREINGSILWWYAIAACFVMLRELSFKVPCNLDAGSCVGAPISLIVSARDFLEVGRSDHHGYVIGQDGDMEVR